MKNPKVVIVSNQKGGIGKTFSVFALSSLISTDSHKKTTIYKHRRKAEKVLVVDTDFQGNATSSLTRFDQEHFNGKGLMEAIHHQDARPYLHKVHDNLYVLPSTAEVATFDTLITKNEDAIKDSHKLLSFALEKVKDEFDWIFIDTSPSLSRMTIQALNVNFGGETHVMIPMQTEDFGIESVSKFSQTLVTIMKSTNPSIRLLGVLPILSSARDSLDKQIIERAKDDFEEFLFETVVTRKTALKELISKGFSEDYARQRKALVDYYDLLAEVRNRVERRA